MPQLIKNRAVSANDWVLPGADAATGAAAASPDAASPDTASTATHIVLPLADYLKAVAAGEPLDARAVLLKPEDQDLAPLLPYLTKLPLIAVYFGSSGEGRGYTQARLLRERHGYKGELRAVGAVRADQIFLLARCGFDAFDLVDGDDPATAIAQLDRFSVAYQAGDTALTHPRLRYGR
jgi:uncharacterized protein (DUF934 family)